MEETTISDAGPGAFSHFTHPPYTPRNTILGNSSWATHFRSLVWATCSPPGSSLTVMIYSQAFHTFSAIAMLKKTLYTDLQKDTVKIDGQHTEITLPSVGFVSRIVNSVKAWAVDPGKVRTPVPRLRLVQFSHSVVFDSLRPMDCSTPGLPVHHQLPEFTQTHVHWVGDAIQPSHPLLSPSPLPLIFPSIRVFSNESVLRIRWPKY